MEQANSRLEVGKIRLDGGTQPRAELRYDIIDDYAEEMRQGTIFPDVTVFFDGSDYWLADGFHRVHAARRAGQGAINADVRQGTRRDAVLYSVGVNSEHGLRRTNDDKRRAVMTLLQDDEWRQWSDREIARRCKVSHQTVSNYRKDVSLSKFDSEKTYTTKHGTTATMDTANIGKSQQPEDDTTITRAQRLVDDAATRRAKALASMLADMPPEVVEVVERYGVDDLWTVHELGRWARDAKDTFEEVRRAGYIQPGDEHEAVCITDTPTRIKWAMELKHNGHAQIGAQANHQLINQSDNNEWYTPPQYIASVHDVLGEIDVDPASNELANQVIKAKAIYTIDNDGFDKAWRGKVFLNPPYGRDDDSSTSNQARWSARLIEQFRAGTVTEAILLVNAVPGNKWFAPLWDFPICFVDHRIRFYNREVEAGQPTHSNAFIYMGPNVDAFARAFSKHGIIAVKYEVQQEVKALVA